MARLTPVLALLLVVPGVARALDVAPAFPDLPLFDAPIGIQDPLDGTDRLFVVERDGRIYVFQNDVSVAQRFLFLSITDSVTTQTEGGLLGLAFHPDYEINGRFYIVYTNEDPRRTILSRFMVSANPDAADPGSELRVIELPQNNLHHKGGCLAFGPDGYLYLSLGDDGNSANSQDLTTLAGKVLRIDVDNPSGGRNYGIPSGNPFAGGSNGEREEIYAFGFRNPWRFSFDPPTGRLWLGDVGQNSWEEIDLVKKGRNYGWPRMEGNECYSPPSCDTTGLDVDLPLLAYAHDEGSASITGGFVYRGPTVPCLAGKYIYTDYITGQVWALAYNGIDPPVNTELALDPGVGFIPTFGVDKDNELYFTSFDGVVYRFFESATSVRPPMPPGGTLVSVHPNPFAATVTVEYTTVTPGRVVLEILDVRGRRVSTLVDGNVGVGAHTAAWDGRDPAGHAQASGVYFCRLTVKGQPSDTRRIIRLK